ncbi:MAG: glycosyltransferase family 4 protein [Mesorhizobium sp.]|nr:glycosyltransferase family 4 protein [Mesorhizobium sp.]
MSVLHLWHSRGWRGGENQFRLLAGHLADSWRGHLGAPAGSELARRLDGVLPIHAIACNGLFDPGSVLAARRLISRHGLKLIHAHDAHALSTAILARIGTGARLVVSRRNAFAIKSGWKYRAADAVVAVSSAAADELMKAGVPANRITIVPDAVDLAELDAASPERSGLGPSETIVLCVAAFSAEKDHATLLRAWAEIEKLHPEAQLHLAGSGRLEDELRRQAAALSLERVRFLGWRNDVAALIKGADIVVLSSRAEGLGSSLCEAQAAGKAVVATSAGGIPEAVEDGETGLLSPPGDAQALAEHLKVLLADPDRRKSMGEAGRARARICFAPEAIAGAHAALYASLLSA